MSGITEIQGKHVVFFPPVTHPRSPKTNRKSDQNEGHSTCFKYSLQKVTMNTSKFKTFCSSHTLFTVKVTCLDDVIDAKLIKDMPT